jgi:hypothetical protein
MIIHAHAFEKIYNENNHMVKIIIVHGNHGSTADTCWIPWLKAELEKQGFFVNAPTMPDNVYAKASIWLPYMEKELQCDEATIIIGHSSGAVAAMRYAENHKVLGSVLIGAAHTDLGSEVERMSGYFSAPWFWEKIKANQEWIIQLASPDDPYIPMSEAQYIHKNLDTEYYEFPNCGHFLDNTIPEALSLVLNKLACHRPTRT